MTTLQEAAMRDALEAAQKFCAKVEAGNARSTETYADMKRISNSLIAALTQQGEPIGYFDPDGLAELQHCNGMRVWAESSAAHEDAPKVTAKHLVPLYTAAPAPQHDATLIDEGTKSAPQPAQGELPPFQTSDTPFVHYNNFPKLDSMTFMELADRYADAKVGYGLALQLDQHKDFWKEEFPKARAALETALQSAQPVAPLTDGEVCKAFGDKSLNMFNALLQDAQDMAGIKEVK